MTPQKHEAIEQILHALGNLHANGHLRDFGLSVEGDALELRLVLVGDAVQGPDGDPSEGEPR